MWKGLKKKEINKYVIRFSPSLVATLISILLFISFIPTLIPEMYLIIKVVSIILGVIISLLLLIFNIIKIEITKDKSNNKIIIKLINFLCFPKKIIIIDRENFHFTFKREEYNDSDGSSSSFIVFTIINDFKNLLDIDLDTSNIKQKPVNFYYIYDNVREIEGGVERYKEDLNNFLDISSDNYENPLHFDVYKYMKKNTDKSSYFSLNVLSEYMKFSEHFFTFHFQNLFYCTCFDCKFLIIFFVSNFIIVTAFLMSLNERKDIAFVTFFIFLFWNIIFYIIYKLAKKFFDNIYRIDCIFSRNFDRIFIGLVKYTKTSYVSTFEFPLNNIDRFILEKISYEKHNLVVIFKNGENQLICNIKKNQEELEGLAYILNEKLIKNDENMNPTIY